MISLILAMDENRLIGKDNGLPWYLPNDLKYFKKVTMNHIVVMGRKTFQSIGKPLPGRKNIVITRNSSFQAEGCEVIHALDELEKINDEEIFVIGGSQVYKEMLPFADKLYITKINATFEGDSYFPPINENEWTLVSSEKGVVDERNLYNHQFLVYKRLFKKS
ncbi:dihydrofolate reductase [Bacillus carboniphilus]|uniref:Dihydrofolate reductase n=1 Tax=Bacillus carboniphilus TaxID=86663 RepID=A0ABY9JY28_9BACI|nr:dihydrofolate reductase [Bacillus carboniphilus]WLR43673.1 dihydrofolate reductase [Bacillus carboniphilus]